MRSIRTRITFIIVVAIVLSTAVSTALGIYEAKNSGKNAFIGAEYNREIAENIQKKEEESFRQG